MRAYILTLIFNWKYLDHEQAKVLDFELSQYENGSIALLTPGEEPDRPRQFWMKMTGVPLLRQFAMKVFAIVPHAAAVDRLFSSLSMTKTKSRNNMNIKTLKMIATIRATLRKTEPARTLKSRLEKFTSNNLLNNDSTVDLVFSEENLEDIENDKDIETFEIAEQNKFLDELFDFDMYLNEPLMSDLQAQGQDDINDRVDDWDLSSFGIE